VIDCQKVCSAKGHPKAEFISLESNEARESGLSLLIEFRLEKSQKILFELARHENRHQIPSRMRCEIHDTAGFLKVPWDWTESIEKR